MLHSRLRPLPRRSVPHSSQSPSTTAPPPTFQDQDDDNNDEIPEDLFTSFLPHLFPDDAPSFHGDPGQHLLYSSPLYGALEIMVPSYPSQSENRSEEIAAALPNADGSVNAVDEGRKLFAHFLWSAAMVVAEGIERADQLERGVDGSGGGGDGDDVGMWRVKGETVLELGAGAALPSVIAALAQASAVTVTDHPSSPALLPHGAIDFNMHHNIHLLPKNTTVPNISRHAHEWGTLESDSDPWPQSAKGTFTRIIAADCLWMASQHENLARTMLWFLAPGGRVWVVAGFHTGRGIVAGFFETAVRMGLEIERIYERDLNPNYEALEEGEEVRREWMPVREGEGVENRKRWCVVAVLKKAD